MAEFKNVNSVRRNGLYKAGYDEVKLSSVRKKRLASAVRKRFRISNFNMQEGTFDHKHSYTFTGTKNGFTIRISKVKGRKGFYGVIRKRGKGESFLLTDTLKEALGASSAIIKEAKGHGRVLRTS